MNTTKSTTVVAPITLNAGEAAAALGVSRQTLSNWRSLGIGPTYVKLGGRVGYRPADLQKFADKNVVKTAG